MKKVEMKTLTKEQWISEVYELLCKSQGAPNSDAERKNIREWAESIRELCEDDAKDLGIETITPAEAHYEEMCAAS